MVVNKIRYQKDEELELGPKDKHENGLIRISRYEILKGL